MTGGLSSSSATRKVTAPGWLLLVGPRAEALPEQGGAGGAAGPEPRQVQRHIADLETAGFVERVERRAPHGGKSTNMYDLGGLVKRLKKLEPDFRKVEEHARKARRAVSQGDLSTFGG